MKEASRKLKQWTLKASRSAISSPGSEAGPSPCNSQGLATKQNCGQDHHHANHSVQPENNLDNSTIDTLRLYSSVSLASAALQSSLGNRLRLQLQNRGCAIYKLTWKEKVTPSGLPYSQLVASAHRTNATDFSSARTTWPTPTTRDHKDGKECQNVPTNSLLGREVWKANWPTPRSADGEKNVRTLDGSLSEIARKGGPQDVAQAAAITQPIRITVSGRVLTGSDAGMGNSGQLNPAHSRWLMGFPQEWDDCAATAMQSSRKLPPNSSPLSWAPFRDRWRAKK